MRPTWLRRLTVGAFVYALILFIVDALAPAGWLVASGVSLDVPAVVGSFHLMIATMFTVGLRDPKLVGR